MPTITRAITASADDYSSNDQGVWGGTFQLLAVNTFASDNTDNQGGFRFAGLTIPRYARIDSLVFNAALNESPPANSTVEVALEAALNPVASTVATEMRGRALTTARVTWSFLGSDTGGAKTSPELKTLLQEQVDKGDLATFIVRMRDSDRANTTVNRRLRFQAFDSVSGSLAGVAPSVTITYDTSGITTFTKAVAASTDDASANNSGGFSATQASFQVGTSSTSTDVQSYGRFLSLSIPRYNIINNAVLRLYLRGVSSGDLPVETRLDTSLTPAQPSSTFRSRAYTSARGVAVVPGSLAVGAFIDIDFKAALQEQVNKSGWAATGQNIGVLLKQQNPASTIQDRLFAAWDDTTYTEPQIIVSHSAPVTVTAQTTLKMAPPRLAAQGGLTDLATGTVTFRQSAPRLYAEAEIGTPAPRTAKATFRQSAPRLQLTATIGTATANTPFSFEMSDADTHAFVTEAGEVLRFSAGFDITLGGVRTGIAGESDQPGAWFAESGLRSRLPETKLITALLIDRSDPKRDGDRMKRLLPDVRELWLPDGDVIGLEYVAFAARPHNDKLELILFPTGPEPQQPFLDLGTLNLALPTESSTPERPLFGFDPAGSIRAPLLAKDVSKGTLKVDAYVTTDGTWGLASVGPPIDAYGETSGAAIYARLGEGIDYVYGTVGDVQMAIKLRRLSAQKFSAVLAWRGAYARLNVTSDNGSSMVSTPLSTPLPALTEPLLTAGVRSDGLAVAGYIGEPLFAPRYFDETEAETLTRRGYADLTEPGLSWAIVPPDFSLTLSRADMKSLDLAPGESLAVDFSVRRVGGYTGALTMTVTMGEGLTATAALVSQAGDIDLWRVTVTAPPGTAEAAYTMFVEVEAEGADTPGSVLADVRDAYSTIVEVAAGPAIMPNPTLVLYANDPVNKNPTEILKDTSSNNNSFLWEGLARPDIRGLGILSTGVYGSHVRSLPLNNAVQAQQMIGNATICMIWGEIAKTANDGVLLQYDAAASENGVHLLKVQGGFKIRAVNGATTVTSPETLTWAGDHPKHILDIGTTEIVLYDQTTGQSISLNRPAWPDATVRLIIGGLRDTNGVAYNLARAHLHALTMHPYSLSALQRRRNMGALTPYDPGNDVTEYPDSAVGIFTWDDGRKYVNDAAPALAITAQVIGSVLEIPGGVYPQGGGACVRINTGIANTGPSTVFTKIKGISASENVEYNAQVSLADSSQASASGEIARHADGRPFLMIRNTDFFSSHIYFGAKPVPAETVHRLIWKPTEKRIEGLSYYDPAGARGRVSNNTYPGLLVVGIGAIPRANGVYAEQTKTKNLALIICRGLVSSDQEAAVKTLLGA